MELMLTVKNLPANEGDIGNMGLTPEKEMSAHSNILVWEIPWTEHPGRLQPVGLQRVGYD